MVVTDTIMSLYMTHLANGDSRKEALQKAVHDLIYFMEKEDDNLEALRSKFEQTSENDGKILQ